jgi:hypothetical protein
MNARRRELLAAALAGAGVMSQTAEADAAAANDDNARILGEIHDELREIRRAYFEVPREIQRIRDAQNTFLRATSKYPEIIEVGTQYWDVVSDWLRESPPQPAEAPQLANGRYTLRFGFTTLVLRPEVTADFLGNPQDRP